jgi:mono/diheme cytochrome c family protein
MLFFLVVTAAVVLATPLAAHAFSDSGQKANEEAGAVLFRDKGCAHCHGEGGIGSPKAPALIGIWNNKLWTPAKLTDRIMNGGQKMPPFSDSLTDAEIAQLVAYLRARRKPVPSPLPPGSPSAQ